MRDIARLLFGQEASILSELFGSGDDNGDGMADRARRAGEWCGSTPSGTTSHSSTAVLFPAVL